MVTGLGAEPTAPSGDPGTGGLVPLTMNRADAIAFTGLSPKLFVQLERAGSLTGRRYGRNGRIVYLVDELKRVVGRLFDGSTDIDKEFEGIG